MRRWEILPDPRLHIARHMPERTIVQEAFLPSPDAHEAVPCPWRRRTNEPDRARQLARGPITQTRRETTQTATPSQRPHASTQTHRQATFGPLRGSSANSEKPFFDKILQKRKLLETTKVKRRFRVRKSRRARKRQLSVNVAILAENGFLSNGNRTRCASATSQRTRGRLVARTRPKPHRRCGRVWRVFSSQGTDSSRHIQSPARRSRARGRAGIVSACAALGFLPLSIFFWYFKASFFRKLRRTYFCFFKPTLIWSVKLARSKVSYFTSLDRSSDSQGSRQPSHATVGRAPAALVGSFSVSQLAYFPCYRSPTRGKANIDHATASLAVLHMSRIC